MGSPTPIVTLTLNPAIDGFCEAETVRPIHKIRTRGGEYHPGGGGVNVARVIHGLGGSVLAIYLSGGATGTVLDALIADIGLPSRRIGIVDHTRLNEVVLETSSGLEFRFVAEGPQVSANEWQACHQTLMRTPCDWLVLSGSLPPGLQDDAYATLIADAGARGTRCALDTSGQALSCAVERGGIDLLKPSLGEFETLVGRKLPDIETIGREARALASSGRAALVAVTLGRDGAILANAREAMQHRAPPVIGRSAVGAGDSFLAGMVSALSQGRSEDEAFRMGMAAGAAAVLRHGPYLCDPADVARLFAEIN